jgi:hypothetical protein
MTYVNIINIFDLKLFIKKGDTMARQSGHLKYKGTIGEIRHFKIKGLDGHFAGLKGGVDGERIKTGAEFVRTRENMNEFGGCAVVGKSLRSGLSRLMKQMSDPQVTGRLTGIMKRINKEDQSEARGYRAVLVTAQPKYLTGFNFNRMVPLESVLNVEMTLSNNVDRNEATVELPVFDPKTSIKAPAGATHFRLIHAVSVLSDFAYNADSQAYEPVEASLNEINAIGYSSYLSVEEELASPISIMTALPGAPTLTADVSVLHCIGIEFVQMIGSQPYLFSSGNALKIQRIF